MLVIGDFEHTLKQYTVLSSKIRVEEINRLVLKTLGLKKDDFKYLKLPDYVPYPIAYFYLMKSAPCDIYIKIPKKEGDEYLKRLRVTEVFNKIDLFKYEDLGLKEFYILKDDCQLFLNSMLLQSLEEVKHATNENKVEVLEQTFNISADLVKTVGITPQAKIIADQTIVHIATSVAKADKLSEMLNRILDDEMSFSYKRSYLISLLASTILPKLDWVSGEQQNNMLLKLTMVSYFHDIYLSEEKFLKVMSNEDFKKIEKDLIGSEKELILNHANRAALLLQNYPKLPQGVDMIVKQHHGVTNGVGFSESYSSSLSPMTILFIVLEEYAHRILINENKLDLEFINHYMLGKFTQPSYKKIVNELIAISKKSK